MKKIWIINQYLGTPSMGVDGHRHYYLAKKLVESKNEVTLFTGSFSHVPKRNVQQKKLFGITREEGFGVAIVKTPLYGSARGLGRIWSMLIFMLRLFFFPSSKLNRPDVVVVSSPSLLPILNGLYLRYKYGCKLILEIRDIWPLSIIELGGFSPYNPFVLGLRWIEKLGYRKYDYITSLLPLAKSHIEDSLGKKITNFAHIPNGVLIEEKQSSLPLNTSTKSEIPKDKFIIGYAGSLGIANAMTPVIEAANKFSDDIALCIVGAGYEKPNLEKLSLNTNIHFLDPIRKLEVVSALDLFDVLILSWEDIPLYRFGVSANKIFDYMYAAKPIIMAGKIGANIIQIADCGIVVEPNNPQAICDAVNQLKNMSVEERQKMGQRGKQYILEHNTFDQLSKQYQEIFASI